MNNPLLFEVIDLFAGAGGVTQGIESAALDGEKVAKVVACVNHDEVAITSHKANHPGAVHFIEDIRQMDVTKLPHKRSPLIPYLVLWASMECTNFSKAKGGLPRDADSRTLAEHMYRYVEELNPDAIMCENVEEFMSWGPLDDNGKPVSRNAGRDYLRWVEKMKSFGYNFDFRIINAADHGAYTSRKRWFCIFYKSHFPFAWPEPTHAKKPQQDGMFGTFKKWKPVRDVLDFSNKGESIFTRKKPLSDNTLKRIYAGLVKYVAKGDDSFLKKYYSGKPEGKVITTDGPSGSITTIDGHALVQVNYLIDYHGCGTTKSIDDPSATLTTKDKQGLIAPVFLVKNYSAAHNHQSTDQPCGTLTTKDRFAAVWLDKTYGGPANHQSVNQPAGTVMANDKHYLMQAFLVNPQYASKGGSTEDPCFTLIARMDKAPPYLAQIEEGSGMAILIYPDDSETMQKIKLFMASYGIVDICMRMLTIAELKKIQGFPDHYILNGTKTQ